MKICIPTTDDRGLAASASGHFGHAPYFALVDTESGGLHVIRNPGCHQHPQECHHVDVLAAHDVNAVACEGMGRRAVSALRAAGIEVLAPAHGTVAEIVAAACAGGLQPLALEAACKGAGHTDGDHVCHGTHAAGQGERRQQRRRRRGSHGEA
jgi:predicted Fe-Mo cluster-binding NifX family protein